MSEVMSFGEVYRRLHELCRERVIHPSASRQLSGDKWSMVLTLPRKATFEVVKGSRVREVLEKAIKYIEDNPTLGEGDIPVLDPAKLFSIGGGASKKKLGSGHQIELPSRQVIPEEEEARRAPMYFGYDMAITDEEAVFEGDYSEVYFPEPEPIIEPKPILTGGFTIHEDDEEEEEDDTIHFSSPAIPVEPVIIKDDPRRFIRASFRRLNRRA